MESIPLTTGFQAANRSFNAYLNERTTRDGNHRRQPRSIIGSGPAGYTVAIYAARAMLEPVLIQGVEAVGQLTITTYVENYPGLRRCDPGPWLMEQMAKQAADVGTSLFPITQQGRSRQAPVLDRMRFRR